MSRTPPKVPRPNPVPVATSALVEALGSTPGEGALAAFWDETAAVTPLIEAGAETGQVVVTFLWRDEVAEQVLLFVNRLTDETDLDASLMIRVPGSDVWHRSYRMRSDWRASYSFVPQYAGEPPPWVDAHDQVAIRASLDRGLRDPRNPEVCRNRAGVLQSVASMPTAPAQPWLDLDPRTPTGTVHAEEGPDGRTIWVYAPASPEPVDLPVVIMFDGDVWTSHQSLPTTLDNLIAAGRIPPVYALMVDSGDREARWRDLDANGGIDEYVVEKLLPWARARHPLSQQPADVVVAGQSLGGLSALRVGLRHPGTVGNVLAQSASLWQDDLSELIEPGAGPRIHLEVGVQEWVLLEPHRRLAEQAKRVGLDLHHVEYDGGHDYACWRGGLADGLIWLLGPQDGDVAGTRS